MGSSYRDFEKTIRKLKASGRLSSDVMIFLAGRITEAAVNGEITIAQGHALEAMMDERLQERYADVFDLGTFGSLEADDQDSHLAVA